MNRSMVVLVFALLLTTPAVGAPIELPSSTTAALITLGDGSEVRIPSYDSFEVTATGIAADHATGRMELRGDVRIKVVRDGSELITIKASAAVITRLAPEIGR